ncbi:tail completion protein [Erwinia phage FBB1]|nr:tail completion protein [Erwinia phage FBB1]
MSTYNQTNTTNFVLEINDSNLTKAFTLNVQSTPVPGIRIPISDVPGGTQGLTRSQLPGTTTEFEPLTCRFLVDENLDSWVSMYKWMLSINNYIDRDRSGWRDYENALTPAATMHILDNDKVDIILSIHMYGAWCSDLSEIEYSLIEDSDPSMICTAIIPFKYFEVEKDGIIITGRESLNQAAQNNISSKVTMHPSMR